MRGCGYRSGRGVGGVRSGAVCRACQYAETLPPPNPYHLNTPSAGASPPGLSWLESVVKQAEEHQGGWVVLVFHNVCDLCGTYAVSPDTLDHFLAGQVLPGSFDLRQAQESLREVYEIADLIVPGHDNLFANPRSSGM